LIGDRHGEGSNLGNLGRTYQILGETEKACGLWREALAIFVAIESPGAKVVRQALADHCSDYASVDANVTGESERKIAAVRRLRGIAKSEGEPPSDEELKEDYADYLTEKYS